MLLGTLGANFEICNSNYQNDPRFNGLYSRNKFPNIRDGAYVIGTH